MKIKSKSVMRAAYFKIPALSHETFEGFTKDERWDGWSCPYFNYEQARKLLKIYNEPLIIIAPYNMGFYDFTTDAFVFPVDCENEPEIYRAVIEDGQKYYQIGARSWMWKEVSKLDSI